jgi:hypothetical protein
MSRCSDTESERNVVYDMCFEPTLDPSDAKFRGLALNMGLGGYAGVIGEHPLFDFGAKVASPLPVSKADLLVTPNEDAPAPPPRFQTFLLPHPSSVVLCSLAPEDFMPSLNQTLEAHKCVRCESTSGGFFANLVDELKWSWRFTHVSHQCAKIEFQVSVWDVAGSDYEQGIPRGTTAFAVEFSRVSGDGFVWNALRTNLIKELEGGGCDFLCPCPAPKRPAFQFKPTPTMEMGADAPEPMDQADESMFQPLLAMLFQQSPRMQLEALRACNTLVTNNETNIQVFAYIFCKNAQLCNTLKGLMSSGSREAQRLVASILLKTTTGSRAAALEYVNNMQSNEGFQHLLESIARSERLQDASI